MIPRKDVADKHLHGAITGWDKDIETYRKATGKSGIDPDQHRLLLMQMCSTELRKCLRMREHFVRDFAAMRLEISDYLHETLLRGKDERIAAIEETPGAEGAMKGGKGNNKGNGKTGGKKGGKDSLGRGTA